MLYNQQLYGRNKDTNEFVSGENLEKILGLIFNELFYCYDTKKSKSPNYKPFWLLNAYYKYVRILDNNYVDSNKNQILISLTKELYVNGFIFLGENNINKIFKDLSSIKHTKVA